MPTFDRDSAAVHYTDTGSPPGDPRAATIFFGHGLLFGGWMFRAQVAALRDRYRCVTIDWRGQGDSAPAAGGYDMDTLTDDAGALIDVLGVGPVHYVGLSMGGFVGQRLAARRGELVRTLTLLGTSASPEDPDKARKYRLMASVYRLTGISPLRRAVQPLMFGPRFLADPGSQPVTDEWADRLRRCRRPATSKAVRAVADRRGIENELGRIAAPTLVIVGEDDAATPPPKSRRIAELIDGARLVQIPECGHSTALEQPERVSALLGEFVGG
ncbi:alpha/beta fold hydrolase [Mycobacterium sp. Marseille-P9652]|uniref:alpha/beta fold hydrolase n=1 Tax=Mycobacterium sp. Marseille-P9652 TaxID=2654950 RepID=UPI0012E7F73C|nr:alpha/beta fold hydrolase [Mycobacterium sp. Marseille-P9652]